MDIFTEDEKKWLEEWWADFSEEERHRIIDYTRTLRQQRDADKQERLDEAMKRFPSD